jgi:dTDP-4-amino-4,6-dideoxygalactose transaminase
LDTITAVVRSDRIIVVDDCAHGLGGRYNGRPNGATAPLSFFSTQWSKAVSTGLGGFAVDSDGLASDRLRALEKGAEEPFAVRDAALRALLYGRARAGRGRLFREGRAIYRALGRRGFVPGSSSQDELDGPEMPRSFLMKLSDSQARLGSDRLRRLPTEIQRRRAIAHRYSETLLVEGRTAAAEPAVAEHAFLRYPLRVADRRRFLAAAERAGVDVGDWFISPIHPVTNHLERWGYVAGRAPNAERACREIVNLPTEPAFNDSEVDRTLSFLARHVDLIV